MTVNKMAHTVQLELCETSYGAWSAVAISGDIMSNGSGSGADVAAGKAVNRLMKTIYGKSVRHMQDTQQTKPDVTAESTAPKPVRRRWPEPAIGTMFHVRETKRRKACVGVLKEILPDDLRTGAQQWLFEYSTGETDVEAGGAFLTTVKPASQLKLVPGEAK